MDRRPNILFLMSDEHRADVAGFAGNTIVRTPTLDWLAQTGVVFTNAYTPSPICVPGRQCMMAGQFARHCKCEVYGDDLAPGYMTFARRFSQYAYSTIACGKLHHMGTDQLQGWLHRSLSQVGMDNSYIEGRVEEEFQKYTKRPSLFSDEMIPEQEISGKWSDAKEILRAGVGKSNIAKNDEYAAVGAIGCIDWHFLDPYYDKANPNRPMLLKVSFQQPHYPYFTDEAKFNYYLNRVKPYENDKPFDHPFLSRRQVVPGVDVSERDIIRAIAAYYGMIETIDSLYKRVLDALEDAGQNLDDWIIVYTTDHGEMLGEHGIWEKQKFFEGSVRVPLIIRWPKGFDGGRVIDKNVNLCDLFATLCDLAGIPVPDGLDSRSLVPLLKGEPCDWDNESVSQFGGKNLMIKQDDLKYQYYGEDMPEVLFDLKKDPGETVNFMSDPAYGEQIRYFRNRRGQLGF